jgi:hypothetical protein
MSDWDKPLPNTPQNQPKPRTDEPGFVDGIPVEDLVRMTREFTARITNEDRQRVALELSESGHQRSIQSSAPLLLQQFFTGKIDLDVELSRRYPSPPLLSSVSFTPELGAASKNGFALFSNQDNSGAMSMEITGTSGALNISFLLQNMIAVRFTVGATTESNRRRFVELMQRKNGIAFLWTRERWERDYVIIVVRDYFARLYAFGPSRFDGACRLTPDMMSQLMQWLTSFWKTPTEPTSPADEADEEDSPPEILSW